MKLFLKVRASAKLKKVERVDEDHFIIWVREPARNGKANQAVIKALSKYLNTPRSAMNIVRGHSSKNKTVKIE